MHAAEFLYRLGDPRTLPIALDAWDAANEAGRYNIMVVLTGVAPQVGEVAAEAARPRLEAIRERADTGPKTRALIGRVIDALGA
ncbi:hypothetical protein JCR33_20980 [Acuticoccus sp. 2012]|uniref:Uncharacterized protein n=1 Tax=Acuticoccus mangrovi TaxID=2796142 RepID=A0A934IKI8_9HYPH|nr:hypothetical protein [Acuticoccus mangrovi]